MKESLTSVQRMIIRAVLRQCNILQRKGLNLYLQPVPRLTAITPGSIPGLPSSSPTLLPSIRSNKGVQSIAANPNDLLLPSPYYPLITERLITPKQLRQAIIAAGRLSPDQHIENKQVENIQIDVQSPSKANPPSSLPQGTPPSSNHSNKLSIADHFEGLRFINDQVL